MCIVSREAKLSKTNILVVPSADRTEQLTVYQNVVANKFDNNAMILPVLFPKTIELIDMTSYKRIFDDCDASFPKIEYDESFDCYRSSNKLAKSYIPIQKSGSYLASICMNLAEIKRIDPMLFVCSDACYEFLEKHYNETCWGFIICRLESSTKKYEPFAYKNMMIDNKLLVPTRHFHGTNEYKGPRLIMGTTANDWDHDIYLYDCKAHNWQSSFELSKKPELKLSKLGLNVNPSGSLRRYKIHGEFDNKDLVCQTA